MDNIKGTIFFRVNSSKSIGAGHLYRCLTLAGLLRKKGLDVKFISLNNEGNLNHLITNSNFECLIINNSKLKKMLLGAPFEVMAEDLQLMDAELSFKKFNHSKPVLLVVDSYNLSYPWEKFFQSKVKNILVIDDLFNRKHYADFLLNQNYKVKKNAYSGMINKKCKLLLGSQYALLREEFNLLRKESLARRKDLSSYTSVLIMMGAMDNKDYSSKVIKELLNNFNQHFYFLVMLSSKAPFLSNIIRLFKNQRINGKILVDSGDVAKFMLAADFAIGGSGSSSWERCCMGLPSIQVLQEENQNLVATNLYSDNCIKILRNYEQLSDLVRNIHDWGYEVSKNASKVTDGLGATRVIKEIFNDF